MMDHFRDKLGRLLGRRPAALQVAALCMNLSRGRVLLVTSRGTGRWILPKGWPMSGRTLGEAALQEAWEEAGVIGHVMNRDIGSYHYNKKQDRGFAVPVLVSVFGIEVSELRADFPEARQRKRGWFTPAEAAELVEETELKTLLRDFTVTAGLS